MPQLIGVARIGRDAETRFTAGGDAVTEVSLAFNYGRRDPNTKERPTQWVKGAIWGERGQKMAEYLTKGSSVYVVLDDAHIEEFAKRDGGSGSALVGRISTIEFAGSRPADAGQPQRQPAQQAPAQSGYAQQTGRSMAAQAPSGGALSDMDDSIPF